MMRVNGDGGPGQGPVVAGAQSRRREEPFELASGVTTRPLASSDSVAEMTDLLHRAYGTMVDYRSVVLSKKVTGPP
jgi:hypothetical protein